MGEYLGYEAAGQSLSWGLRARAEAAGDEAAEPEAAGVEAAGEEAAGGEAAGAVDVAV